MSCWIDDAARPLPFLRQQVKKSRDPRQFLPGRFHRPGDGDWIGGFAVGIHGIEPHLAKFKAAHDDYSTSC
jgi:5-methyltetrahydrofolate--homocysteine methyltransferase